MSAQIQPESVDWLIRGTRRPDEPSTSSTDHAIPEMIDTSPGMDARSAVNILDRVESRGVAVWVGGGWGIDALAGTQTRVVLRTDRGHQVDLHPVVIDELGNGWQPLGADAWAEYPAEGLGALGSIAGRQVRCLTPELQLRHHLGYPLRDDDRHDLRILAGHYQLPTPPGVHFA